MERVFPFVRFSIAHPRMVMRVVGLVTLGLVLLAGVPSLWPQTFPHLSSLTVDTDPENMLPADAPVRVFHNQMKRALAIRDMVVIGVVDTVDPNGVFNTRTLANVHALTEFAKTLRWPDEEHPGRTVGVITQDILAPSTLDSIEQDGVGAVRFEWLMPRSPTTEAEALAVRDKALSIPFLKGTVVSEDGKALALYLPVSAKALTYRVYSALQQKIAGFTGDEHYYITGLPVAEDNFGVEMFIQMAISAPIAMMVIFLLMLFFFRKLVLVIAPMLVAMVSVMCTMGLLIATGHTVHIMSSMIPIFIMPIAVLDSVHILSQFFDRYQETQNRQRTIEVVMDELFTPMFYTSLTTAAGFASLALAPIPPVQVFGLFVAFGVMLAWLLTVTFIPAFVMRIPERKLANFGMPGGRGGASRNRLMAATLHWVGGQAYRWAKPLLAVTCVVSGVAIYGIAHIVINDNPMRWFTADHPIRVADGVLNSHFGGTYMGYLTLAPAPHSQHAEVAQHDLVDGLKSRRDELMKALPGAGSVFDEAIAAVNGGGDGAEPEEAALERLQTLVDARLRHAIDQEREAWREVQLFADGARERLQLFKSPAVLRYLDGLQQYLLSTGVVGKSNSVVDIVKTVHRELLLGKDEQFRVPDTSGGVAQTLLTFQNSHRPQDLWHFVTPDFRRANIWVQMRSGDNVDMSAVAHAVDRYLADHPPPVPLAHGWFGLNYINVVWQDRMVSGMLEAFLGSFLVVFLMMLVLLRSGLWALLSMVPLTLTIGSIYGLVGLIGKDYDMPVAVLSALSLGLAVDFAIHFLVQARKEMLQLGSWAAAAGPVFDAPARAITRNGLVISIGFLPLLLAPLVPYQTVGTLIAAILFLSGGATLAILPALMRVLEPWLFPRTATCRMACSYMTCTLLSMALYGVVAVNLHQFAGINWGTLAGGGAAALLTSVVLCGTVQRWTAARSRDALEEVP